MATSLARKAAIPASATLVKAWSLMPPRLCAAPTAAPTYAPVVPLPCEQQVSGEADHQQQASRQKASKSFRMHIGGSLHIPSKNALEMPHLTQQPAAVQKSAAQRAVIDPFEGLPFRGFAERMGEGMMPTLQAAREAERAAKRASRRSTEEAEVLVPQVPHLFPFTRWAASSTSFRSTFIADPPKDRKKARLSWYHPDDTMVPRDWFKGGLLADIKYYMPFGLGAPAAGQQQATA